MPVAPTGPSTGQKIGEFHSKHWRIIWAVVFFLAPLGSLGDDTVTADNTALKMLAFVGIFVGCWLVSALFFVLFLRERNTKAKARF